MTGFHQNQFSKKSEGSLLIVSRIRLKSLEAIREYEARGGGTSTHYRVYRVLKQGPATTTEIIRRLGKGRQTPSVRSLSAILTTSSWARPDKSTQNDRAYGRQITWVLCE